MFCRAMSALGLGAENCGQQTMVSCKVVDMFSFTDALVATADLLTPPWTIRLYMNERPADITQRDFPSAHSTLINKKVCTRKLPMAGTRMLPPADAWVVCYAFLLWPTVCSA
jgi:hypothetical protein